MNDINLSSEQASKFEQSYTPTEGCWLWRGSFDGRGYGQIWDGSRYYKAHRIAYVLATGVQPGNHLVDHICHVPACVNPKHLRLVDHKQNGENRSGLQKNNASGVQGVYWSKQHQSWHARVQHYGKRIHIGRFESLPEAEAAVVAARKELFTHNELDKAA